MKAFLMFKDRDFDPENLLAQATRAFQPARNDKFDPWRILPWNARALAQDLETDTLFAAMSADDTFLFEVSRNAVLSSVRQDSETIFYRQKILADCLDNPEIVRELYALSIKAIESERKKMGWSTVNYPAGILSHAVDVLQMFVGVLKRLRSIADRYEGKFASPGFTRLFAMLKAELGDAYFAEIERHLKELRFSNGVLLSARLGKGNKGTGYVLRKPADRDRGWLLQFISRGPPSFTLRIAPRDDNGLRNLSELRDRGVTQVANALARSTKHILGFFQMLRTELAFYVACLNLRERLAEISEPICFPEPLPKGRRAFSCRELYDASLALTLKRKVVGNDIAAGDRDIVVITGANQGGKSTFLRSAGIAQIMMQAGMFVPAAAFSANLADGVFTHFKREEDAEMESGKLDEELGRMSEIVDHLGPDSLVLFNESFAATNEREGSEIARQIISALISRGVKVLFVTHLHEFARDFHEQADARHLFLRAERQEDGRRTFKLIEADPLPTSFGVDLYDRIFESRSPPEHGQA